MFLRILLFCFIAITSRPRAAEPLQMILLENHAPATAADRINVESRILERLQQLAQPDLQITVMQVGNLRALELLKLSSNYCALNKLKTSERLENWLFAEMPTSIYPPLQLISTEYIQADAIDLAELLKTQPRLKIGIVGGRHYGASLDQLIKQNAQRFYVRNGDDAAENLAMMLNLRRLDAIIEFTAIVEASLLHSGRAMTLHAHPLKDQPAIRGYLVCNKSPQGKLLIGKVNQLFASKALREAIVQYHQDFFSANDWQLLETEVRQTFQVPSAIP